MNNLGIENIAGMIRGGGAEGASATVSDSRVQQVMRENGMSQSAANGASSVGGVPGAGGTEGTGFSKILSDSIARVNEDQQNADHSIKDLVAGKTKNMHEVMLTLEKADSSLKLAMQVRNKMLEAYKEIMRMQV